MNIEFTLNSSEDHKNAVNAVCLWVGNHTGVLFSVMMEWVKSEMCRWIVF